MAAGEYSVRWDGEGPSVDLKFVKDGKEVAETPAVVVTLKNPSSYDAVVLAKDADGSRRLKQVCFSGKRLVLEIGAPPEGVPPYICD